MNNPGASRGLTSALSELLKREWLYTPGWRGCVKTQKVLPILKMLIKR
jgi:hypothetical protein